VWVRGEPAQLTPREFRLLRHLIAHRDRTMGHDDLLASVWGRAPSGGRPSEVLKQYIWRLRQKIEADPESPEIVVTVAGAGYRFITAS
jgi:two-component system, OmpR family, KDP operon response regulator KdpE